MDVIVKESKIDKKGVFANRDFQKGEMVIKWDSSHELTKEQAENASDKNKHYISNTNEKYILMQSPERYVNHSCEANTSAKNFSDVAIKNIKKGEEITGNYSEESLQGEEMTCKCESKNCRKVIKSK